MTRFKLIPWLAIPALLLLGPMMPTATAATSQASVEDGLIYLPLDDAPASLDRAVGTAGLTTSATPGEVTVAQYGAADFLVANRNRFLAVRFDLPFQTPYTITGLTFPSRVQIPNPARPFASFRSVRILGADGSGNLDKSQTLFRYNRYLGNNDGSAPNNIPLNILVSSPAQTFYAVFEFPSPTSGVADTFPFLFTDVLNTEAGLFANSFASDTSGAPGTPPGPGTATGTTLLVDQNLIASLTCVLSSTAPLNAPSGVGMNARSSQVDFAYTSPANVLADGSAAPNNYLDHVDLVRRDAAWVAMASGGAGAGKVTLATLPGSGLQIWGIRAVDKGGNSSLTSNVTLSGSTTVVGQLNPLGADADEANGRLSDIDATALSVPVADRDESIWPAGDQDNFSFFARPGDIVTVTATPAAVDFRNDLDAVVQLFDNSKDVLGTGSALNPGEPASLNVVLPPQGGSHSLRRYFIQVVDKSGSALDPAGAPRVLVPCIYHLTVDVQTPATLAQFGADDAPISALLDQDRFAFANVGANPVRGNANFGFVIPRSSANGTSVKLRIYDVRGRAVTTLVNGVRTAGTHFASWSGHDSRGNRVASGPYFARIEAGSWSHVVRIDLVK